MTRIRIHVALVLIAAAGFLTADTARAQQTAPPGGAYQKVSDLVELPEFLPGMGVLWVDPGTLPAGPFLAYDRDGSLVSTIFMVPLAAFEDHQAFSGLDAADAKVDHVDVVFNAGHPGVTEPHYHVVLWHVSPEKAAALR